MDRDYLDSLLGGDADKGGIDQHEAQATESGGSGGISVDPPYIHITRVTLTDKVAAEYLNLLTADEKVRILQLMVEVGAYALTVGTRQVAEIDLEKAVTEALHNPLVELETSLTTDADERERRLTDAILRQREKFINTPALAGGEYEDFVEALLRRIAMSDVVDRTSRTKGTQGDVGDICVDSDGTLIVVECKRGYADGMSNSRMNAELARAKANRQADAGILAIDSALALGGHRLRKLSDINYAVVVTPDDSEDGLALQSALLLVKAAVQARRGGKADGAALLQHANALHDAVQRLDDLLAIFNDMSSDVDRGRRLVEDSRQLVQAAARRLDELTHKRSPK